MTDNVLDTTDTVITSSIEAPDNTTDSTDIAVEAPPKPRRPRRPRKVKYGEREIETLAMLARGIRYEDIASELDVSINTVKGHLKRIYAKLGARSGAHAVSIAIGRGMIDAEPPVMTTIRDVKP